MFSQIYGGSVHFYIASHRPVLSELLCPEGEKAWRTTFHPVSRRGVPVGKANITSHPPFTELFHGVYERLCPQRGSYKGLQVYHRSRCEFYLLQFLSPKKKPTGFSENRVPSLQDCCFNTIFPSKISYLGYPNLKILKIHHLLHGMIFFISPTVMPPIYYVMKQ